MDRLRASMETAFPLPRAAYIHIPFCRHRCGYCNFALVANRDYLIDRYLDALAIELSSIEQPVPLDTLFLGGGTPTHLDHLQLNRLFEMLSGHFQFENAEVTTEANPSDLHQEKIRQLVNCGVNRFSLGVQSFHDEKLTLLERDHRATTVRNVVRSIQEHTENVSLDLIFGVMNESVEMWEQDLDMACELEPRHLSTYELTLEKGTQFWNRNQAGKLPSVSEDIRADMYQLTQRRLVAEGWNHYEISSFAKPGFECVHNQIYWSGKPFYAFGAGAASFVNGTRRTNHSSLSTYIKRIESGVSPVGESDDLQPEARARELLVVGLRRLDGVDRDSFGKITGFTCEQLLESHRCQALIENGLLEMTAGQVKLAAEGVMLYDSIAETILRG